MARFGHTLTAMVSPFAADGSLDLEGAQKLAKWLVANGNDGLVVAGTTGESPTLTHDEQIALIEAVVEAVDMPVVAGTGSNDTRASVELTERATAVGATAILSVTPYYNRPVLQPPKPGRHRRPLSSDGGCDRPSGHSLRHSRSHRSQDRNREHHCPRPGDQHCRVEGRRW